MLATIAPQPNARPLATKHTRLCMFNSGLLLATVANTGCKTYLVIRFIGLVFWFGRINIFPPRAFVFSKQLRLRKYQIAPFSSHINILLFNIIADKLSPFFSTHSALCTASSKWNYYKVVFPATSQN